MVWSIKALKLQWYRNCFPQDLTLWLHRAESLQHWATWVKIAGSGMRTTQSRAVIGWQIENAPRTSFEEIYAAILARTVAFHAVQSWFEDFDIVAMPTISRGALSIDYDHFAPIEIDGKTADVVRRAWYPYTSVFNLT